MNDIRWRQDEGTGAGGGPGRARAFTLIELLIVVAILAVLMSLLAPSLGRVKVVTRRIFCGSDMRQLTVAWWSYGRDHNVLPVSNTSGTEAWTRMGEFGNSEACVTQGSVWPYVKELSLYRCPGSAYDYYVSYGLSGRLRGEANSASRFEQIADPGGTMTFIEEYDNRGYNMNSFLIDPKSYCWIDAVAGNHEGGDNLSFCDGHVEYWIWQDPRTLSYGGGHYGVAPGSKDLERLDKVWNTW